MDFQPMERSPGAFQQPVSCEQVLAMCRRVFGSSVHVISAIELGHGRYNNTFCVDVGARSSVILRVAPEPSRQFLAERELMRNEHAGVPYLTSIAPLMPRTLGADFTHQVIGRDYLFQTLLEGLPAPGALSSYDKPELGAFFGQLGIIARSIHAVKGHRFGPVGGPTFATWSQAVIDTLNNLAIDLDGVGLDARDVREVAASANRHRDVLDEVTEPRLLHGDLWTVNCMIAAGAAEPVITGVLDCDRAYWGDPSSDWTIYMASRRADAEQDVFWETYGPLPSTPAAAQRWLFYWARHVGRVRLERHRLRKDSVSDTYDEMSDVVRLLRD